jgi:hypothetical protein
LELEPEVAMKKLQRLPVFIALCTALAVPVACGDDTTGPPSGLVDSWTLTRIQDCEFDSGTGDWGTLTIRSNGTYTFTLAGDVQDEGTIRFSGNTVTITSTEVDETITGTYNLSGDTLVLTLTDPDCPETDTFTRS